ncbi:hypothetical protein QYF61_001053 [Mycteria americana]|uniref:Solute carrier family 2, facilitated glucose transporter member 5 n=1 Tax=Mycteria americana TaxID=33587 RepID=A0AAN7MMV2_MYCAM|nr:hypothetical protein QYF61_001053 [Mycteria americana]
MSVAPFYSVQGSHPFSIHLLQLQSKVLILTICAAGIRGTFQYGYNISIINAPTSYIQTFMNKTCLEHTGVPFESNTILLLWSFTVSAYPLGGLTGAVVAGLIAIVLGRKMSLLLNNVFVIIAAVLSGFSRASKSFEIIMLRRFFTGVNAGISMNIQPMYLVESAPKKLRGAVALTSASFTALGLVLGQVVGLSFLQPPLAAQSFTLQSRQTEGKVQGIRGSVALAALQKLRGNSDLGAELEERLAEWASVKRQRVKNPWELFQNPALRWQLMSVIVLSSAMQLCGNYSNVITDYSGRRPLLLGGYFFMAGRAIVFMVALSQQTQTSWMPYLSMACIFTDILSFGIGPAGVTGVLPTEAFDQMSRPAAYMICGSLLWFNLFLKMSYSLFLLAFVLGIGGAFQYGLQVSIINSPAEYIKSFIRETWLKRYGSSPSEEIITLMWSFVVSIYSIGGLLGSLSAGYLSVRFGRKKAMLFANVPALLSATLMGLSRLCGSFEMIIAGRLFSGVCGGLALNIHLMYAGECAPRKLRGLIAITASTATAVGKFVGFALGLREVLGVDALWPILMAANALPALVQLLTLPFFPDSPRYLLIDKKDKEGCIKAVKQLWGDGDHMAEIDDMMAEQEAIRGEKAKSVCDLFHDKAVRWQLITLFLVSSCMQLIGVNVVYFYAYNVFIKAGIPPVQIHYVSLGVGITEILTTVLCGFLIERAGRKTLLWKSYTIMALALGLLTVTLSLQEGLGSFSFIIFLTYCLSMAIFVFLVMPETKGKTMLQVMEEFNRLNYRGQKRQTALQKSSIPEAIANDYGARNWWNPLIWFSNVCDQLYFSGKQSLHKIASYIRKFINETWLERYGSVLHQETLTLLWSFIVSMYCVGGMIGCLCSGYLTAKYGKKKCLMFNDVVLIVATLHTGFSRRAKSFEMILIGRFLEGIGAAMKQLWGEGNYHTEFDDMMKEKTVTKGTKIMNVLEVLKEPSVYPQLSTMLLLLLSLQLCGLSAITFYTLEIFQTASLQESIIPYVSLGVAISELISIIFCDQFLWMRYCSVILIFLFIIAYGIGPAGAVASVMNEIFTLSTRSSAFVIGGIVIWLGLTFTGMIFPFAVVQYQWLVVLSGIGGSLTIGFQISMINYSAMVQYRGLFQIIAVLGIGGTFQIGFQISTITYMSQHVKAFINETWLERYGYPIHQDNLLFLWSITVSIFGIGGLLGSSGSRYLTVKYGKKKCLLCNNLLMVAAASVMGCSKIAQSFEMILIGRFMCGISAGTFYKGIQPASKQELLGSQSLWPMLMASCGLPALVQLVTLPFFPESPPYLLMHKGDQEGCKRAIRQLWGEGHHQAEIDDIMKEKATMKNTKILSVLELIKEQDSRWQLYMIVILTATVQLCGINAIYFYTFEVLQAAGFDERMISYMTLCVGLSELIATVVCSSIIERLGRKVLLRGGYWIMGSLLAGITVTLSLQDWYFWMPYCSLCLIILFAVVFGVGPAGATVSIRIEIFKLSCRPPAFVISAVLSWLGVFVIGMTFPFIVERLKHFCFLIFMGVLFTSGIIIHLFLPETKGKSIVEITEEFSKLNFKKKHVPGTPNHVTEDYTFCTRL